MRFGAGRKECWGLVGDFNDIMHNGEKIGGPRRIDLSFVDFVEMLEVCEMKELTGHGEMFSDTPRKRFWKDWDQITDQLWSICSARRRGKRVASF